MLFENNAEYHQNGLKFGYTFRINAYCNQNIEILIRHKTTCL